MSWLSDRHYFLLGVIFYGLNTLYSVFLWRRGFRHHDRMTTGLLLVGFLFHTWAMFSRGMTLHRCPIDNFYETVVFIIWTMVVVCLIVSLLPRFRFLGAFATPVIFILGVFALMPSLDAAKSDGAVNWMRSLHASLTLLSYGAFGLGAVAASMFLTQERDLKSHKPRAVFSLLPPMERLEKSMTWLLFVGAFLLTLGLALAPPLVGQQTTKSRITNDPKVVWSIVVWVTYLFLLVRHKWFGLIGRRFAWGAILIFVFVLLTFWGVDLISPSHRI